MSRIIALAVMLASILFFMVIVTFAPSLFEDGGYIHHGLVYVSIAVASIMFYQSIRELAGE